MNLDYFNINAKFSQGWRELSKFKKKNKKSSIYFTNLFKNNQKIIAYQKIYWNIQMKILLKMIIFKNKDLSKVIVKSLRNSKNFLIMKTIESI